MIPRSDFSIVKDNSSLSHINLISHLREINQTVRLTVYDTSDLLRCKTNHLLRVTLTKGKHFVVLAEEVAKIVFEENC